MNSSFIRNFSKIFISYILYYSGILSLFLKMFLKSGLFIFNYHCFNTFRNDYWKFGSLFFSNYNDNFEKHVRFFNKYFNKIKSFDLEKKSYSNPTYLLTFDDGYKDNFDIALPILRKHSVPCIFFITTNVIGTNNLLWFDKVRLYFETKEKKNIFSSFWLKRQCVNKLNEIKQTNNEDFLCQIEQIEKNQSSNVRLMMNWTEIKKAHQEGIVIGSHTHTHPILTNLSYAQQIEEIKTSIEMIKSRLGLSPDYFSYPQGDKYSYIETIVNLLKKLGVKYSVTTEAGVNKDINSPYNLKRIGINPSDPIPILAYKICNVLGRNKHQKQTVIKLRDTIKQYDYFNSIKRLMKKILKKFGIHFDTYYILHRYLDKEIQSFATKEKIEIKKMTYKDFEESKFFHIYSQTKKDLYKERFSDKHYQSFGAKISGELVYITWIATDFLMIDQIHIKQKLKNGEGILVDSYTLPRARGLGIHSCMNAYRLEKLKELGVKKVYAVVLAENRPALKTQLKHGFQKGEKVTWFKCGKVEKYFKREIDFK